MLGRPLLTLAVAGLLAGAGCFGNSTDPFPPGLAPLDPTNLAAWPPATATDPHPETVQLVSGRQPSHAWAHGAGFVHAPIDQVWKAMRDPMVCADRRRITRFDSAADVETGYDYSYRIHNVVESVITVEFDNTWRQSAIEGTKDAPIRVAAAYQKTQGTDFITLLAGSFQVRRLDDGTTSLELMEHLQAEGQGADTAEGTLRDYFASIVARVHGQPLPTY